MSQNLNSINKKTIISVSRNNPVALVVGAAGFFGSHLADKLLDKGIQVIGVDNLSGGRKDNLNEAVRFKNFHFLLQDAGDLNLELARLDYVFIVGGKDWDLANLLNLVKMHKAKCLFVSTIDLYDEEAAREFEWYKRSEIKIARYAAENNLNARVLRLGAVYGSRMSFNQKDPIVKLIQSSINNQLQKDTSLEFSTRALYILDAVDLMIKAMLSGETAQKIFDGVLPTPIKVSEIKQILLDPVWYEQKGYHLQELPLWSTPNLLRTIKILNWEPKLNLVSHLKKTLSYFKDHEIKVPKLEDRNWELETGNTQWKEEKKEALEGLKKQEKKEQVKDKGGRRVRFNFSWGRVLGLGIIVLILYALVFPVVEIGWGVLTFRFQLSQALNNLGKGEFPKSLQNLDSAKKGVMGAKSVFDVLDPIRKTGQFSSFFDLGDNLYSLSMLSLSSAENTVLGTKSLYEGILAVTGETNESPKDYFSKAQLQLSSANEDVLKAQLLISDSDFTSSLPKILLPKVESLKGKLSLYSDLVEKGRASAILLPEIVAIDGVKSYLILLQNNNELRPTGGFIGSYAQISFEGGKLKKIDVNDIYAIDGQLNLHVEPPKEIKEDLGQNSWYLRDSNWEADFPTSARQAEWFFTKETGQRVSGVVALDIASMEKLLEAVGPLDLPDYSEKITPDNLFEKSITHAENSFFAGSQAKKNFLSALTNGLFNKIFFLPKPNWPGIVKALGDSLESKHMSIFLDDPKLFSYLISQNWAGVLPRQSSGESEKFEDFLAPVEANLGANKSNYYLDRSYNLETVIGKEGDVKHRLKINYVNKSPSNTWPAGVYKNRMRIYLPFGAKLTRVLWGETNITKDVSAFVDYGRSGFSMLLQLEARETKALIIDYEVLGNINFTKEIGVYKLNVVKQAGTLQDPFVWRLTYPLNYKPWDYFPPEKKPTVSSQNQNLSPQEQTIQTDLSKDRSFEVRFKK